MKGQNWKNLSPRYHRKCIQRYHTGFFKETYTPKSMNPTSTKLSALVNNWLNQASVKRETVFLLGFRAEDDRRGCVGFPDKSTERTGF